MKTGFFCIGLVLLLLVQRICLASDPDARPLRIELDLIDSSRVIGIPAISSIPVQTSYAKMDIALDHILNIAIEADHENATFRLANGDNVKGVINLAPVRLETVFGKVTVGTEFIRNVRVRRSIASSLPARLKDSLFLHYSFEKDKGDKIMDGSSNGNHGVVYGAKWVAEGFSGGAFMFDGDDYIQAVMKDTSDITFAMWFKKAKPNTGGNTSDTMGLFGTLDTSSGSCIGAYLERVNESPNTIVAMMHRDAENSLYVKSDKVIADTSWHYLVVVRSGADLKIYLDGVDHTFPFQHGGIVEGQIGTRNIEFGSYAYSRLRFQGMMDEIEIYNSALTADEVKILFDEWNLRNPGNN